MNRFKILNLEQFLRISFACIILYRVGIVCFTERFYFGQQVALYLDCFILLTVLLLIIGFFVPLAYILLNIFLVYFDSKHEISTLGTSVACLTSFSLLANYLTNKLPNRKYKFISIIEYYTVNYCKKILKPRVLHLHAYYAYALCSFFALSYHIFDTSWRHGETTARMLTSSYLCRFHTPFLNIENNFPLIFYIFSCIGVIGQTLFQALLPLALFNKFSKIFIIFWGWIFIINCTIFFQLSYLPLITIILWISLFHYKSGLGSNTKTFNWSRIINKYKVYAFSLFLIYICYTFYYYHIPKIGSFYNKFHFIYKFDVYKPGIQLFKIFGLDTPNVFNYDDLKMSDHWMVIFRSPNEFSSENINFNNTHQEIKDIGGEIVPITHINGEKGYYQQCDILYFGNTVRYKRHLINEDPFYHHSNCSLCSTLIENRILFDYRFKGFEHTFFYKCYYFDISSSTNPLIIIDYAVSPECKIKRLK